MGWRSQSCYRSSDFKKEFDRQCKYTVWLIQKFQVFTFVSKPDPLSDCRVLDFTDGYGYIQSGQVDLEVKVLL
jgi:hypothetical protein